MSPLTIKLAIAAVLLAAIGGGCFYLGGLGPKVALANYRLAQATAVADAVIAEQKSAKIETDRLNTVIRNYEQAALTPVDPGIGHSVYKYALSQCPVSRPGSPPSGAIPASTVPSSLEGALQTYIDACSRDALRLNAIQAAWPR